MELWIRSQDKMILTKAEQIGAYYTMNKKGEIRVNTYNEISLSVGHYSTMKRALEVLDDIQSKIKNQYIVEFNPIASSKDIQNADNLLNVRYNGEFIIQPKTAKLHPVNSGVIIYEMPEEEK